MPDFRDVLERAVAAIVVEHVLAARQSRRTARHLQALVAAQAGLRRRRRRQIEIDVVGDEEIEPAVAVVVEERAAGAPARRALRQAGRCGHVVERPSPRLW